MEGSAMLMDLLNKAVTVAVLGFVVSSMLAMGSGLTIRQIIEPLRMYNLQGWSTVTMPWTARGGGLWHVLKSARRGYWS
jgi:hypothetical protein